MDPFIQGKLDGLCGIYAVTNAAKLISKTRNTEEWQEMFLKMMKLQIKHKRSMIFMVYGVNESRVAQILQRIIGPKLNTVYRRPFKNRKKLSLTAFWDSVSEFLKTDCQRAVILTFETKDYGHWTVIQAITENRLILFDSTGRQFINRKQCSTTEITSETPVLIDFSAVFYLQHKPDQN